MATGLKTRNIDDSPRLKDRNRAYFLFGKAMASWARLEAGFYSWFEHIEGMDTHQAKPLYYSVSNFKSRLDLIRAALNSIEVPDIERHFIEEAMKLAIQYNGVRNKLAHGEFTTVGLIIESKYTNREVALTDAITHEELDRYATRFNILANILWQARDLALGFEDHLDDNASVETCHREVTALLREIHSETRLKSDAKRRRIYTSTHS